MPIPTPLINLTLAFVLAYAVTATLFGILALILFWKSRRSIPDVTADDLARVMRQAQLDNYRRSFRDFGGI